MVIKRATSTRKSPAKVSRTTAKATPRATKATKAVATKATKATAKTTRKRVDYGLKERVDVNGNVGFPARVRNSTKESPYADDISSLIGTDSFVVYDGVTSQEEFTSFANTLRNLAKRLHDNRRLQIIWVENDSPTHPAGVYVRDGGTIQTREKKSTAK